MHRLLLLPPLLLLAACVSRPPMIVSGGPDMVVIEYTGQQHQQSARDMAQAHCLRERRSAELREETGGDSRRAVFACR